MADAVDLCRPKMTHNPFLQITLSTKPLGLEAGVEVTCQYVLASRKRSRGKRKNSGEGGGGVKDSEKEPVRNEDQAMEDGQTLMREGERKGDAGRKRKVGAVAGQEGRGENKRLKPVGKAKSPG